MVLLEEQEVGFDFKSVDFNSELSDQTNGSYRQLFGQYVYRPILLLIMYIYYALINALSAHTIHINLNMIFYTQVEQSPAKTIYIKYYTEKQTHALHRHTQTQTHTDTQTQTQTHTHTHTHTHTVAE